MSKLDENAIVALVNKLSLDLNLAFVELAYTFFRKQRNELEPEQRLEEYLKLKKAGRAIDQEVGI